MALDQYTSEALLAQTGQITNVDTRQALVASQSLQNRLDQVSEMALGSLEESAIQRGQMYGVENAPTLEQVTQAIEQDQDVNSLFVEEGTVFGKNARKVQAELFRQDSLAQFLNKAEITKEGIKDKVLNPEEASNIAINLQADIDGTFEVLKEIDPTAAVKFNAQASKIGYGVVSAAQLQIAKMELERKKAETELFNNQYISSFKYDLFDKDDYLKAIIMNQDLRNDAISMNGQFKDPKANLELWKKENKVIQDYIVSKIADENSVMAFINGTDKKYDTLLKVRGIQGSKEDIVKKVLAKEKEMYELTEVLDKQTKKANEEAVDINETDYFGDNAEGLTPQEFVDKQRPLGRHYSVAQKEKIFKQPSEGEASDTQVETFENTLDQIKLGRVGINQIEDLENSGDINGKQYSKLREAYRKQDKYKIGNAIITRSMGIVGNDLNIDKDIKAPLAKALQTFAEEVYKLEEQRLPVDQVAIANDLIGGELKDLYKANYEREKTSFDGQTTRVIKNNLPKDNRYKNITVDDILTMSNAQLDLVFAEVQNESPTVSFVNYKKKLLKLKALNNDY
tara:strand:+ start:865 stop:2568 length:1704 start_codon:yes stop_codon:yes gene_type:complete